MKQISKWYGLQVARTRIVTQLQSNVCLNNPHAFEHLRIALKYVCLALLSELKADDSITIKGSKLTCYGK